MSVASLRGAVFGLKHVTDVSQTMPVLPTRTYWGLIIVLVLRSTTAQISLRISVVGLRTGKGLFVT